MAKLRRVGGVPDTKDHWRRRGGRQVPGRSGRSPDEAVRSPPYSLRLSHPAILPTPRAGLPACPPATARRLQSPFPYSALGGAGTISDQGGHMDPLKAAARFAAFVWFVRRRENSAGNSAEAQHFARENWVAFLPLAHEGLGRLLVKIASPRGMKRRRNRCLPFVKMTHRRS